MGKVAALAPLLRTQGLRCAFGGLEAVRSVDLEILRGEIRAIIGPNGAGKTTLVGMICGRIRPTAGHIEFNGRDITGLPAHTRVALGIVYTYQLINIFKTLTVYENVALAAQRGLLAGALDRGALDARVVGERVGTALAEVGLQGTGSMIAGSLPYGHQRLVDVAMALAARPRMLVLDEPTQGLGPDEVAVLSRLLKGIAGKVTILLIEHNMDVVLALSQRITVMDQGRIIAEGRPAEIEADPNVQQVYLGR